LQVPAFRALSDVMLRALKLSETAYQGCRFEYQNEFKKRIQRLLALPIFLSRIECDSLDIPLRYLAVEKKGQMLDVGCGNGDTLKTAFELGWSGEGVDFDPAAVSAARQNSVTVRCGSLADQNYADSSFDFVYMSHFIEHVHDPIAILSEANRVLRSGGKLVVTTPNAASWGHFHFGADWRGLEPPRHLHVFTPSTLMAVASRSGFDQPKIASTLRSTPFIFVQSRQLRAARGAKISATRPLDSLFDLIYGRAGAAAELLMRMWNPVIADELLLEASK